MPITAFRRLLLSALIPCASLWAQLTVSTIRGTATDQSGSVVVGAQIRVVHQATNSNREVTTNENGDFEFLDLPRGEYRLTATQPGFKTFVADNILLESSQVRRINVAFELGTTNVEVSVRADAALIATESGKISTTFEKQRFEEMPLIGDGRTPTAVLISLPMIQNAGGVYSVQFAGQPQSQIQTGEDGHTNDGQGNQANNYHDIQEVVAVAVNNTAEFARVGYFDMTSKSGTNKFHAELDFWHQNSSLNARDFFATVKPVAKAHTIIASATGPIIKDRTFFYVAYTAQRWPGGIFYTRNVPTNQMRAGDFSELLEGSRPVTVRDPLNNTAFPGNVIPTSRFNPVSLKVQNDYMPPPNQGGPHDQARNFGYNFPYPGDVRWWDYITGRVDHKFSNKNTIHGRLSMIWGRYIRYIDYPALIRTRTRPNLHTTIEDTHVFSPTLVNTARFGLYKETLKDGDTVNNFTPVKGDQVIKELGIQGVNPQGLSAMGFPIMQITGYSNIAIQAGGITNDDRDWGFADTLTWAKGRHVLKIGGEYKPQSSFSALVPDGTYGSFNFNGSFTGFGYADFLLGIPFQSTRLNPRVGRERVDSELGLFVQDSFKVSSRLTLDLGLRWDHFGPGNYSDGLIYNWDPATGNVIVPEDAISEISPLYPTNTIKVVAGEAQETPSLRNFGPRLGAAWRPFGEKTVIRGSYGIFNETLGRFARVQPTGPFQLSESFFNNIQNGQPLFAFPNPFPPGAGQIASQSISGYPMQTRNGRIHQFNISFEQQFKDIGIRLSYVGARDRGMNYNVNINKPMASLTPFNQNRRPYPQFIGVTYGGNDGELNHNALSIQGRKRMGQLTFDAHFTWTSNYLNYQSIEDPYAPLQWSHDQYTSRLRGVANAAWTLPVGRGKQFLTTAPSVVDFVLGGWQANWIAIMESGQYFTPSFSGADPSNTNTTSGRPDRVRDGDVPSDQRTLERWFDTSAFVVPRPGNYGNTAQYALEGPGLHVHNLTISKNFKARERITVTFMSAIQNLFNHPTFSTPAANISSPGTVGVITSTRSYLGARTIELRLRLQF
jgi:Carboxypeptidase regulatory-like domain/TonB dependent receptor-like, beta-barrel